MEKMITYTTIPPTCGSSVWNRVEKDKCTLFVPEGTMDDYKNADQWKDFIILNNNITHIAQTRSVQPSMPLTLYNINGYAANDF